MLHLLYLLCVFYILWRMVRWLVPIIGRWLLRKQAEKIYTNVFGQRPPAGGFRSGAYSEQTPAPAPKKKVFDKFDGEYVEFVEIEETQTASTNANNTRTEVRYKKEEQISDAEWQDIE